MVELQQFLKANVGKDVVLVTAAGVFRGKLASSSSVNVIPLEKVTPEAVGLIASVKQLTFSLDSIIAWGNP